ncbi:MAG: hypothetical protein JXR48_11205 [Candidatus Delongbacteria bacterium]|nr:hypothetical protein [Candidatus Delongbacteria bacterium]
MDCIQELVNLINQEQIDDIPHYLLLRDIFEEEVTSEKLKSLKESILESEWVGKVVAEQWDDGSWGQFHSLSTSGNLEFTTERAIRRMLNLGLDNHDAPVKKVLSYMESYLRGEIELRDRVEKKHDWGLLTRLFVATWILRIDSNSRLAIKEAEKWAKVVSAGFIEENFDELKYKEAYYEVLKPEKGKSMWGIQNFYIVALMPEILSQTVEERFIDYIMNDGKGIYYTYDGKLSSCPNVCNSKEITRFISAHKLLSRYDCYSDKAKYIKKWLLDIRMNDGLWDFGTISKDGVLFPLSKSWRKKSARMIDCSILALKLLKKF